MNIKNKAKEIVSQMTLDEKAGLCSGLDCWHTKPVERLGLPSIMVSDGPHGLRKQQNAQDNFGIGQSVPATCFPTASLTACSFDVDLLYKVGQALGEECVAEGISVLLGPGVNMKRTPLCGRNFEYFSEDPYVSGKLAASYIRGVQSKGVGTSLKHFAVNNQEKRRMSISAIVDERTLHELYLKAFEIAVKESEPWTVMCSYNRINGTYSSENKKLLTDILRDKWGYQGLVVSDWGAVHNRVMGVQAGLDLEMPGNGGANDRKLKQAVEAGNLSEEELDRTAEHVAELVLKCEEQQNNGNAWTESGKEAMLQKHHELAVKVATESMVLLKNEDSILPIDCSSYCDKNNEPEKNNRGIAIVGRFAKNPRYQGAGSSKINPVRVDSPCAVMDELGINYVYQSGENEAETIDACKKAGLVVVFAGLTERYESEGFDRKDMSMPEEQNRMIQEIAKVNENIVVVLMGGAPISIPWEKDVKSILLSYLGGEGVGTAVVKLLIGEVCPSGKLAETWPYSAEDCLSAAYYPGDRLNVQHREAIYVGYRYFDSIGKKVQYRFGHGLSYTKFVYNNLKIDTQEAKEKGLIRVSFQVKNDGAVCGKEICFIFSTHLNAKVYMPKHQLAAFCKIELQPGELREVCMSVNLKELGYYDCDKGDFYTEPGEYILSVGGSLEHLTLAGKVWLDGMETDKECNIPVKKQDANLVYERLAGGENVCEIKGEDFEQILGYALPNPAGKPGRPFTMDNCLADTEDTFIGKILIWLVRKFMGKVSSAEDNQDQMMDAAAMEMPFFSLWISSGGILSEKMMKGIIKLLNVHL